MTAGLFLALTPGLPLGPHPCNAFALVVSQKLRLRQLWLGGKVFQGDIVGPHHHIFGAYVMAPSFETMYHGPHFLLMGWPPSLRLPQLLPFEGHRPSILH